MRKHLIVASMFAAVATPSLTVAQTQQSPLAQVFGQQQQQACRSPAFGGVAANANANVGVTNNGANANVGAQVAGRVIGALLGQGAAAQCPQAYGYYDASGLWHAGQIAGAQPTGYWDRDGRWVEGAPNGYYDQQGRWTSTGANAAASGAYDRNGGWAPASASGYYDANGQWVAAASAGRWENGRWIPGAVNGGYDANGRWMSGQAAGRMVNGAWVADPQPGYYDTSGRWVRGPAVGYYDAQGRWVSTGVATQTSAYGQQTQQSQFGAAGDAAIWAGAPGDLAGRVAFLDQRLRQGLADGTLRRVDANRALQSLATLRSQVAALPTNRRGGVNARAETSLRAQLDAIASGVRWTPGNRAF